jgi:hypothetical protein
MNTHQTIKVFFAIQLVIGCVITQSLAQKIQIKDGAILKDKRPIGKLEGKTVLGDNLNLKILSPEGLPLIILKEKTARYYSSFYKDTHYVSIEMPSIGKAFSRIEMHDWVSEKKIVKFLFDEIGDDFLSENGLNIEKVSAYLSKGDQSHAIEKDTLALGEFVTTLHRGLSQPLTKRDINAVVDLTICDKNKTMWKGYEDQASGYYKREFSIITQGKVQIGLLIKTFAKLPGEYRQYYILRKVNRFKTANYEDEFIPLAFLDTSLMDLTPGQFSEMKTGFYVERFPGATRPQLPNSLNGEYALIQFLVKEGYL